MAGAIDLQRIVAFGLITAAIHWIIARSTIMEWFWSRARGWLAKLLACPACSGFWIGIGLALIGVYALPLPNAGLLQRPAELLTNGLLGVFLTPVCEGVLLWGLHAAFIEQLPDEEPQSEPQADEPPQS